MGIQRLNHAVLYVRDVERSVDFYRGVLGFREVHRLPRAAFLRAPESKNDHDLGLFEIDSNAAPAASNQKADQTAGQAAGQPSVGLYHLAWSVSTLADLAEHERRLREAGALVGSSDHVTTKALYARDPDGLEFEISWLVPSDRVTEAMRAEVVSRPLNLDAEIQRWGADLVGMT